MVAHHNVLRAPGNALWRSIQQLAGGLIQTCALQ
jgi:hypothetical protein